MGFMETLNYVVYDNPVSQGAINATKNVLKPIVNSINGSKSSAQPIQIITKSEPLWILARQQGPYIKIAAISGATAVALAAYSTHKKYPKDKVEELQKIANTANKMHFFHTLALFGVPFTKNPAISGSLLIAGTMLFSGPCYYYAFTGENKFAMLAPVGGTMLIFGWLAMLF